MSERHPPLRRLLRAPLEAGDEQRLWEGIRARRDRPRLFARGWITAGACACAAVLIALVYRADRVPSRSAPEAALPLRLANAEPLARMEVPEDAAASRVVALSDGTRMTLAAGSRLLPRRLTASLTELALEQGRARFEVQPQGGRRFEVVTGDVRVEVVGTVFTVERARGAARASVHVERGRVRVRAPHLPAEGRLLGAGERFELNAAPAVQAEAAPGEPPLPYAADDAGTSRDTTARSVAPRTGSEPAWRATAARGDYARAYAQLGARGFAAAVRDAGEPDSLLVLSDVARAAGRPAQAAAALSRLLERHPRSEQAALAALTLGRLQLDALGDPRAAARSLRRALELGLPEALSEDALARLVHACAKAGDSACTARAAQQYRERFPRGRFRADVDARARDTAGPDARP
jgi:transmembrane sensor